LAQGPFRQIETGEQMFIERVVPPELIYKNRSPKRSPRLLKRVPAERSLVNCNHLATSNTKVPPEETLAERLARKTEHQKRRVGQRYIYNQIKETLRELALRSYRENMDRYRDGLETPDKGPWSPARDLRRLEACQSEWIGYKPGCCDSQAVAVPIGCNHRLCPLCNAARLERYRGPARELLGAMDYPTFLTLTVPNVDKLTRETFDEIHKWWKEFFRSNKAFLRGGLCTIEGTYNRQEKTWHPHLHIVFDAPWPTRGMERADFLTMKRALEFSWLRITSPEARKVFRRNEYLRWNNETAQHEPGSDWNQKYRRVVDIRPVKNDSSAVYELIKYISKTNRFVDLPDAVEMFLRAVRGVRVIQTFGSFYNFKMEVPMTKADLEALAASGIETVNNPVGAASFLRCGCGKNEFHRIGVFSMADVEMGGGGRWLIRLSHERRRCRGSSTGTYGGE
jgi:hypothetical protein